MCPSEPKLPRPLLLSRPLAVGERHDYESTDEASAAKLAYDLELPPERELPDADEW